MPQLFPFSKTPYSHQPFASHLTVRVTMSKVLYLLNTRSGSDDIAGIGKRSNAIIFQVGHLSVSPCQYRIGLQLSFLIAGDCTYSKYSLSYLIVDTVALESGLSQLSKL